MNNKVLLAGLLIFLAGGVFLLTNQSRQQTSATNPRQEGQPTQVPKEEIVTLTESGFFPQTLTVKAGTKVVWLNQRKDTATVDSAGHPIHLSYPPLNLGTFKPGEQLFLVFNEKGTYKYHNHLSPNQLGTVVVE